MIALLHQVATCYPMMLSYPLDTELPSVSRGSRMMPNGTDTLLFLLYELQRHMHILFHLLLMCPVGA